MTWASNSSQSAKPLALALWIEAVAEVRMAISGVPASSFF